MTKTVSFRTPRGADVTLSLITELPNIADHTMVSPCWILEIKANGNRLIGPVDRVVHPQAGEALQVGSTTVTIPADAVSAVDALVGEYKAKIDADSRAERAYWEQESVQDSLKLAADMDRASSDN